MKILWIFLLLIYTGSMAQTNTDTTRTVDSAFIYLTGTYTLYNPAKAFALYMQRAVNGEAKAMNATGLLYAKGMGTDSNFASAVYWLKQATANGYTKAYTNLGMVYKHRAADSTDFKTAFQYFDTAFQLGDTSAYFAKGYMLYKGLGCNQSYAAALVLFEQAANAGRADAMYFAGLCFRNGYGVAANADSATYYINLSAQHGYIYALAAIAAAHAADSSSSGNTGGRGINRNSIGNKAKPKLPAIATTEMPDASNIYQKIPPQSVPDMSGIYEGNLIKYDYSGKKILKQTRLKLNVYKFGNTLQGDWIENDSIYISLSAKETSKELVFGNMQYPKEKLNTKILKTKGGDNTVWFKSARMHTEQKGDSIYLCGNLLLFDNSYNEPDKPVYLKLLQTQKGGVPITMNKPSEYINPIKL